MRAAWWVGRWGRARGRVEGVERVASWGVLIEKGLPEWGGGVR